MRADVLRVNADDHTPLPKKHVIMESIRRKSSFAISLAVLVAGAYPAQGSAISFEASVS